MELLLIAVVVYTLYAKKLHFTDPYKGQKFIINFPKIMLIFFPLILESSKILLRNYFFLLDMI